MNLAFTTTPLPSLLSPLRAGAIVAGLIGVLLSPGSTADSSVQMTMAAAPTTPAVTGMCEPIEFELAQLDSRPVPAIYEMLGRCPIRLKAKERWEVAAAIEEEADRFGFDPLLVMALVEVESGCSPRARGGHGSVGLLQMVPETADIMAQQADLDDFEQQHLVKPALSLNLGLRYLSTLEEQFGDIRLALAAYNMGPGRVQQLGRRRSRDTEYVRRVFSAYQSYLSEPAAELI